MLPEQGEREVEVGALSAHALCEDWESIRLEGSNTKLIVLVGLLYWDFFFVTVLGTYLVFGHWDP